MANLSTLNAALHAQLERLNNSELKGDELKEELNRADAICNVSKQIVSNANTALAGAKFQKEYAIGNENLLPPQIGTPK